NLVGSPQSGLVLKKPIERGQVAQMGLTAIPPEDVPGNAVQAVVPKPVANGIAGVVWRDFKPGGGVTGKVEQGELGLPGVTVVLRDAGGKKVGSTSTESNGTFKFEDLGQGTYQPGIG